MKSTSLLLMAILALFLDHSYAQNNDHTGLTVNVNEENGVKTTELVIKRDNEEEIFKWTGDEMPEEVMNRLKELNLKAKILEGGTDEEKHIEVTVEQDEEEARPRESKQKVIIKKDGEEKVMEWTGDEMPDEVKKILKEHDVSMDVENKIHVKDGSKSKVYLGIAMAQKIEKTIDNNQESSTQSISIEEVMQDSPAAKAGLQKGDEILKLDGQEIDHVNAVTDVLSAKEAGDDVIMTVRRNGEEVNVPITLAPAKKSTKKVIEKEIIREKH